MPLGIEAINLYAGRLYADAVEIAVRRGKDANVISQQVMIHQRSVIPPFEDVVTLAVNAAQPLFKHIDPMDIGLLIVGTESGLDFGKPITTWVQRLCELSPQCRNFEVKHACYSGTAAFKIAGLWATSPLASGKKALVISTDITRPDAELDFEAVGGGCAVAMVIGMEARIFTLDLQEAGYWTQEVADVYRPTAHHEIGDAQTSLLAYLQALEGVYSHYQKVIGQVDYDIDFKKHIYHAPFPGMAHLAHRHLLRQLMDITREETNRHFASKVADGIRFNQRIGAAYGASNFISLLSLLHYADDLQAGDPVSLFAYGSGSSGEFYRGVIGPDAVRFVRSLALDLQLEDRLKITLEDFDLLQELQRRFIEQSDYSPGITNAAKVWFMAAYHGRKLLVLDQVERYRRHYVWS